MHTTLYFYFCMHYIPTNPKEGQCQRMFKLTYNCAHFTCQRGNAQTLSSQASTAREPRTSRGTSWIQKRQRNQRSNCQHLLDHRKSKRIPEKIYFCFIDYAKAFDCVDHKKLWNILKEMGIPDHLNCLLRNLTAGQESTVRTRHRTMDQFKIRKGVHQGYILSPCSFNLYAEYIIQDARLDDSQAGIKIAGININNLRYADDATLMAESKEELKSLLMKVKEKSEKAGLKLDIQKTKIMASGPITSWQIDGETMETVTDFILGGSKISGDGDYSHEIKRRLLLGRKAMTNLHSMLKSRDITLPIKVCLVKAMVFPLLTHWKLLELTHWKRP